MKLRFTPRATQDLVAIADFIRVRRPAAAGRVRAAILRSLQILTLFPQAGHVQSTEDVRKLVVPRYPYLVYYVADTVRDEIVVLTIQHAAREREHEDA